METISRNGQSCRIGFVGGDLRRVCFVCLLTYLGLCLVGCGPVTKYGDEQIAIDDAYMAFAVVLATDRVVETDLNVTKNNTKRVLYFTADWCGPCVRWKNEELPMLLAVGWEERIEVIDVDRNPNLARKFNVDRRVPTFVVLKNGKELGRRVGAVGAVPFAVWVNRLREER